MEFSGQIKTTTPVSGSVNRGGGSGIDLNELENLLFVEGEPKLVTLFENVGISYDDETAPYSGNTPVFELVEGDKYKVCCYDEEYDVVCTAHYDFDNEKYWGELKFDTGVDQGITIRCSNLVGENNDSYEVVVFAEELMSGEGYFSLYHYDTGAKILNPKYLNGEKWIFELEDGSTVEKTVVIK